MRNLKELLRDGDPLRCESAHPFSQRDSRRRAILAAAARVDEAAGIGSRSRIGAYAVFALIAITATLLGLRVWSLLFVSGVQAAVRFEVRLAEDKPGPGLQQAKVSGSDRLVYLHEEVIVTNADIADARVVQGGNPSQYDVSVEFNSSGAEKMRAATQRNIGKHVAILLDGQVVMTPVLRAPIATSARITGGFTRAQAERIVTGVKVR